MGRTTTFDSVSLVTAPAASSLVLRSCSCSGRRPVLVLVIETSEWRTTFDPVAIVLPVVLVLRS
ncbi:hypothetical protein RB10688 [Rhodopirellula baltica SH 1]|uniref:Uncharacterized protein n=1 Tax=Rhodopirellula baltica (strain DSM 10527 / NCIMB 13988 / SH1) TaxID=243090 RepID=Q7UKE5_RHOBA|nr:hypothetical protein RB10688 [Rhodopirellula baltica SH 1]